MSKSDTSMFSSRFVWEMQANTLTDILKKKKRSGVEILDLTNSNPTSRIAGTVPIEYPYDEIREALSSHEILCYSPDPKGLMQAREAIAEYYESIGVNVHPDDIILTASTSEGYSYLFKLLTDPGDEVLLPRPSYPLFDFITGMEMVGHDRYAFRYAHRWELDRLSVESAMNERTKAIVAIHPNNPTGNYLTEKEQHFLLDLSNETRRPLIVDEVFYDYLADGFIRPPSFASINATDTLVFTLNGFSKMLGLPQMKLGWITVHGNVQLKSEAKQRLELITDTYLSVNTPVMQAVPELLALRDGVQSQIHDRCMRNYETLTTLCANSSVNILSWEGGWNAVIALPEGMSSDEVSVRLLEQEGVLLHPAHFYDFKHDAMCVISLLTPVEVFTRGIEKLVSFTG